MYWSPYPFLRIAFALIAGILLYHFSAITFSSEGLWSGLLIVCLLYVGINWANQRYFSISKSNLLGALLIVFFGLLGIFRSQQQDPRFQPLHLLNHQDSVEHFVVKLQSDLQSRQKSYKAEGKVILVNSQEKWHQRESKILLYFARNDTLPKPALKVGDEIIIRGKPQKLEAPKNPREFDYKSYLAHQQVYFQNYLLPHQHRLYQAAAPRAWYDWQRLVAEIQARSRAALERYLPNPQSYAVASALTLGIKDDLDNELRQSYAAAGLMHVLAVSGLHVGVIAYILTYLLSGLKKGSYGKLLYLLIICTTLWTYAFVTGFSPSVVRAVLMFSLLIIGDNLQRNKSPFNTLAASAFILLLYNPAWIFSVGFQLSYLAVAGIFYLYPLIYHLFTPRYRLLLSAWNICAVSIAAQIATFPLGLYYFGQFPNYFLLSNLLILPAIGYVLGACFLVILTSFLAPLAQLLGYLSNYVLMLMNGIIAFLEQIPGALTEHVYMSAGQTLLIYLMILFIILLFARRKFVYMLLFFLTVLSFSIERISLQQARAQQEELIVYHLNKQAGISIISGLSTYFLGDKPLDEDPQLFGFSIKNYLVEKGSLASLNVLTWQQEKIEKPSFAYQDFESFTVLLWHKKLLVIIKAKPDRLARARLNLIDPDYCIIQNKSLWDLSKISPMVKRSKEVILDGSNGFYRCQKLAKEAEAMGVKVHNTFEKGAFHLKLR